MLRLILIISCLVIPTQSMAMTLQWSTGTAAIAFSTATRCTLIINGAPATSLPNGWRLVWVTQDCTIDPIPSEQECLAGSTSIFNVLAPSTPFELASGERTAQFCEPDSGTPTRALVVFDLPPQARGKLKAIALDPADLDSMQVIESNIATFNGGVEGSFPPAILRTSTQHQSTTFNLSAVGTDLEAAASLSLAAHDGSWSAGLQIDEVEPNLLSATGSFASSVPACVLLVSGEDGIGAALVESDPPPPPLDPQAGCQQQFIEDIYPPYTIQAKALHSFQEDGRPRASGSFTSSTFARISS